MSRPTEAMIYATQGTPFTAGDLVRTVGGVHLALNSADLLCHTVTSEAAAVLDDPTLRWRVPTVERITCKECLGIVALCAAYTAQTKGVRRETR